MNSHRQDSDIRAKIADQQTASNEEYLRNLKELDKQRVDSIVKLALARYKQEVIAELELEKDRYCTECFNPCYSTNGGFKCVLHGYSNNDYMTARKAKELKAAIEGVSHE